MTNNLKAALIRKRISKATLARRIGVSRSYITKMEKHESQPSAVVMFRIAHYLKCPVEEVFQLTEQELKPKSATLATFPGASPSVPGETNKTAEITKPKVMKGKLV